jgi:hypothetical protein
MKYPPIQEILKRRFRVRFENLPPDRLADVNAVIDDENQQIDVIRIDLRRKTEPARSFLHELLHLYFPEMAETQVGRLESRIWKTLNQHERWMVYRRLFRKGWEGGPVRARKNQA